MNILVEIFRNSQKCIWHMPIKSVKSGIDKYMYISVNNTYITSEMAQIKK